MTIDWWGLGLQAVNVLILMWLLSRVFWRPVAGAIDKRQRAAQAIMDKAEAARKQADDALADVTRARDGIASERDHILAKATAKAETTKKSTLSEAREKAEKLVEAARLERDRAADAAKKQQSAQAAELAVDIAGKLLQRLDAQAVQAAFLDLLVDDIAAMPQTDRAALIGAQGGIDLVSAADLDDCEKVRITNAVEKALGGDPRLTFVTDPDLIAGFEMRTAHFVLHNSWQSDLESILEDLRNAA